MNTYINFYAKDKWLYKSLILNKFRGSKTANSLQKIQKYSVLLKVGR